MRGKFRRKDLKRNDLAETFDRTVGYVSSHRRGLAEALAIGVGAAVLAAGFFLVRAYRENRAGKELSEGLAVLQAPLSTAPGASSAPGAFATTAARRQAADEHFHRAASYGGTTPARAAAVILAAGGQKSAGAAETFTRAARGGGSEVAAAAEIDASRLLVSQGKTAEAIERLKRAIDSPEATIPKDALLFTLGQIYDASGASSDARATYQRIVNDYPNSPYRPDARNLSGVGQ